MLKCLLLSSYTEINYICIYVLAYFFSEATQTSEKGIAIENEQNETKDKK